MESWEQYIRGEEEAHEPPSEVEIDLKWILWTTDESIWTDYAPEAWALLQAYPEELTIHTAPRKEIRFGTVVFQCDGDSETCKEVRVHGGMNTEWDERESLLSDLGYKLENFNGDDIGFMLDMLDDHMMNMDFPPRISFDKTFPTLQEAIAFVDEMEYDLLKQDEEAWKITLDFADWLKGYMDERRKHD